MIAGIFNLTYFLTFICNHIYFLSASICMIANSQYSSEYSSQITLMAFTVIHTFSQSTIQWVKYKVGHIESILKHKFNKFFDGSIHFVHFLVALVNIILTANSSTIDQNGLYTLWNISLVYNIITFITNSASHYISYKSSDGSSNSIILSII